MPSNQDCSYWDQIHSEIVSKKSDTNILKLQLPPKIEQLEFRQKPTLAIFWKKDQIGSISSPKLNLCKTGNPPCTAMVGFPVTLGLLHLVYDWNQVSVSGTETFFLQSFSNILMFFCFLWGYKFLKAWNWTQIFKNNLKIFNIWQQIWY